MRFQVEYEAPDRRPGFGYDRPRLREGDRVVVYGVLSGTTRVLAQRVVVVDSSGAREERLTGVVRANEPDRDRLILRLERGSLVEVAYGAGTTVARLGRRARPEDVAIGDTVWVEGRWTGNNRLIADRIEVTEDRGPRETWRSGDVGEVVAYDRPDREIQVRFGRTVRRVDARQAEIRVLVPRRTAGSGLRPGARVRVYGEERGASIVARRVDVIDLGEGDDRGETRIIEGQVRFVDPGARTITLATSDLGRVNRRVYVPSGTSIFRSGRRIDLREIQTGDRIRVQGEEDEGRVQAASIEVLR
jgi:Cu/Ag efflux protein CusF